MILTYPSPRPVIHRGDSLPAVTLAVAGLTIDPAGAVAVASLFRVGTGEPADSDLAATLTPAGTGPWTLSLSVAPDLISSTTPSGLYFVQFTITFAGPERLTVPADDSLVLLLTAGAATE